MIIDIHSHAWQYPEHFTDQFRQQAVQVAKANESLDLTVTYAAYRAGAQNCDKTIVFGGKARRSGIWIDDRYVADYVAAHPEALIRALRLASDRFSSYILILSSHTPHLFPKESLYEALTSLCVVPRPRQRTGGG